MDLLHLAALTDGAIFAALLAFRLINRPLFERVFRCALILAGIAEAVAAVEARAEAEPRRVRRFWLRLCGVPSVLRAALRPNPEAVPIVCKVMIAMGAAVPVVGPIDEAGAVATVAGLTIIPEYRNRVLSAWNRAK
jgi:hypothetical protein